MGARWELTNQFLYLEAVDDHADVMQDVLRIIEVLLVGGTVFSARGSYLRLIVFSSLIVSVRHLFNMFYNLNL